MSAAGTRLQAVRGINDTPDAHYQDVMRISRSTANPGLVRLAVDNAAVALEWLLASTPANSLWSGNRTFGPGRSLTT